jgi:aspartyl-tRNA(Asn)/glutamyl-tRNA(Gln) amidotransferase subunit B
MRSKEEAYDYRYFPEPDLVLLAPDAEWIDRVAASLGPMPADRRVTLVGLLGGAPTEAQSDQVRTVVDQQLDALVVAAVGSGARATLALARAANELSADASRARALDPVAFAGLLGLEESGALSATQSKAVLAELVAAGGGDPEEIARAKGFEAMSADTVAHLVGEVVAANADAWERYRGGDDKLAQFFIGKVMQATRGQADGKAVVAELRRLRS